MIPEDNIVSEEESMVENEADFYQKIDEESQVSNITDEVIVADIDDEVTNVETEQHSRPKRDNISAGVDRL